MSGHDSLATGLAKIGLLLRSDGRRRGNAAGLTPTQAQILAMLAARGPARAGRIAEEMALTQPTISDAVAALVRKGHVARRADPGDARAVLLHLTASGRHLAADAAAWPDALLGALDALDPDERAVFGRGLTKMIRALQERGAIPVQRMCASCLHFRPNAHSDAARPHHCAFVDAAFGDAALRLDCADHGDADAAARRESWHRFIQAPAKGRAPRSRQRTGRSGSTSPQRKVT